MDEKKYRLLEELLPLLEEYESKSAGQQTVMGFSVWLNQRLGYFSTHSLEETRISLEQASGPPPQEEATVLTMLIAYLYRYAKHYTKKALEGSPLSSLDEFGFMVSLLQRDSLKKSELINLNLLELTSGIEIIKRLEKQGFMEVYPDPDDGRSKRVRLTEKGKGVLWQVMPRLQQVARVVSADLTAEEKQFILPILNRLNEFHAVIHHQDRKADLESIEARYL